jgi:hypothetical protein
MDVFVKRYEMVSRFFMLQAENFGKFFLEILF